MAKQTANITQYHVVCDVIERRAVVFKCLTCSIDVQFDDVTDDVILPLGWGGSIFLGESQSHIYPNRLRVPNLVAVRRSCRKGGGGYRQRDTAALYSRLAGLPGFAGIVASFLCRHDISHNVGPTQKVYKPSHHWDSDPVI